MHWRAALAQIREENRWNARGNLPIYISLPAFIMYIAVIASLNAQYTYSHRRFAFAFFSFAAFFILVQYGRFIWHAMLKQIWWNMLALNRSRHYIAVGFRLTRSVSNRYIYNVSRGRGNSSVPMSIHVSTLHFVYLIFLNNLTCALAIF